MGSGWTIENMRQLCREERTAMRDETQEAILHVIKKRNGARMEDLFLELNEIYPKREIKRQFQRLLLDGELEFDEERGWVSVKE
jgi:hypothetical protein